MKNNTWEDLIITNLLLHLYCQIKNETNMKKVSKEKQEAESDLIFYLRYYKELENRSQNLKEVVDKEIDELIEKLKEIK